MIMKLATKMKEYGVVPEFECFDLGMINYGKYLISKGIHEGPYYWNLLFGNIAGFQGNFLQIGVTLHEIPDDHYVAFAGLGASQLKVNATAMAMGFGVRVGVEDNIWWDEKRSRLATNKELLQRVHQLLQIHGKEIFPSAELGALGFYNRIK